MAALITAVLTALLWTASAVAETPEFGFKEAENNFRFQDYKAAEKILRQLLHPEVLLKDPEKVIKAREYLGACYFWLKDYKRMEEEFTSLLTQSPNYKLDPFYYPATLIDRVEKLRAKLAELRIIDLGKGAKAKEKKPPPCLVPKETVTRRSQWVALIPFGAGQFQNGHNMEGALFLTGEALALATNIGSYVAADRLRGADGLYSPSNARVAKRLRIVQYVSLGVLVGLAVWGVVDASLKLKKEERSVEMVPCPAPRQPQAGAGTSLCVRFNR
ncbi:MAG: hypothetical protein GXP54_12350 [Deltaproteobacteria bacterium]|nr:hypothetical protein [Deltaproteobacteria bacterium]